jgi:hypothetical protein
MAYGKPDLSGAYGCPASHPFLIPSFTLSAVYTVDASLGSWHLSSDEMPGMARMPAGSTFHADWWGAWDDKVLKMWEENCIDKLLNCSGGDLGNGKQMKMFSGFRWEAAPRLVDPPRR